MVKYSPVCHEPTKTTFFSACHAGCKIIINDTTFGNCACVNDGLTSIMNNLRNSRSHSNDWVNAGPCKEDCFNPYITFSIVTMTINLIASSGRTGNILVSYRCVEVRDKSLAQGLTFVILSIFALIPAPIIFGSILDYTCLIWDMNCNGKGNCWFYHKDNFRYYTNVTAAS